MALYYTSIERWGDMLSRFQDDEDSCGDVKVFPFDWWRNKVTVIALSRAGSEVLLPVLLDQLGGLSALGACDT